jgi:predicted DCC family thiol-disulfide oxidoreductase YuxK
MKSHLHSGGDHLILYDGMCGLCDRWIQFVLPRDHRGLFVFAPLQSPTARSVLQRFGRCPAALDTFYVVRNYQSDSPDLLWKGKAALFVLEALGGVWGAASALRILPAAVLDGGYDLVARNRYRWFGRLATCRIPAPHERARFIDVADS